MPKKRRVKRTRPKPKKQSWKDASGLRKEMEIKKLMLASRDHDHEKCNCKGCYWWIITRTVFKEGRMFEVIPSWKDMDRDEYLRTIQRTLNYRIDKKIDEKKLTAYLIKQGVPKDKAPEIAKKMLDPMFMVMLGRAPSKLGLLRDI